MHGGMSMAIGYGVSEQLLFDEKTGRPLNNNLLDYKLSTAMDHPHLEAQFVENYEPTSAYGTKALGEPPACPGAPASATRCSTPRAWRWTASRSRRMCSSSGSARKAYSKGPEGRYVRHQGIV